MQTKVQMCLTDINLSNQETRTFSSQIYPFELDQQQDQKSHLELLNIEMKTQIDKEFEDKIKDPNALLPTDLESIELNDRVQEYSHQRSKPAQAQRNLGTRGMETMTLQKDDKIKVSTHLKTSDFGTSKIGENFHGHTELSNPKSKGTSNLKATNTDVIEKKMEKFVDSLKNENRHLVMTESENKLMKSGR